VSGWREAWWTVAMVAASAGALVALGLASAGLLV